MTSSTSTQTITLGGGCFWCVEAGFAELQGIQSAVSGYAGGHVDHPTYRQVCDGTTGHAEVVQVTYDPAVISTHDVLEVFFTLHDPTTLNRQGNDIGTQYRSAIYYHTPEQREAAEAVIAELNQAHLWSNPIVTEVEPLTAFCPAEDYHQHYFRDNARQPYCQAIIAPKLAKLRKRYAERLVSGSAAH